jgi:hypothetical protein
MEKEERRGRKIEIVGKRGGREKDLGRDGVK